MEIGIRVDNAFGVIDARVKVLFLTCFANLLAMGIVVFVALLLLRAACFGGSALVVLDRRELLHPTGWIYQ